MKIQQLKEAIYQKAGVSSTKELKRRHPDFVEGLDFRRKSSWQSLYAMAQDSSFIHPMEKESTSLAKVTQDLEDMEPLFQNHWRNLEWAHQEFCLEKANV